MRWLALFLGALGLSLGFWHGEPLSPALDATYRLAASRWESGRLPHAEVESPADWVGLWFYRLSPAIGTVFFRVWRALGLIGLAVFFWRYRSRERSLAPIEWLLLGVSLGLWGLMPYGRPGEVGFPLYVWGLWLGQGRSWSFGRGVLLGGMTGWHPAAALALGWWIFYRLERKEPSLLLRQCLGWLWGLLVFFAALKVSLGEATLQRYLAIYQLGAWRYGQGDWRWQLNALSLLLTLFASRETLYLPYRERRLYRERLWAGLAAGLMPALWLSPMGLWVLLGEGTPAFLYRLLRRLVAASALVALFWQIWSVWPRCYVEVAPHGCVWGTPTCYLRLRGAYGCDFTSPYQPPSSLEKVYDWLDASAWIYDYEGAFTLLRPKLPLKLEPYRQVDTLLPAFGRLYQRCPSEAAGHTRRSYNP